MSSTDLWYEWCASFGPNSVVSGEKGVTLVVRKALILFHGVGECVTLEKLFGSLTDPVGVNGPLPTLVQFSPNDRSQTHTRNGVLTGREKSGLWSSGRGSYVAVGRAAGMLICAVGKLPSLDPPSTLRSVSANRALGLTARR